MDATSVEPKDVRRAVTDLTGELTCAWLGAKLQQRPTDDLEAEMLAAAHLLTASDVMLDDDPDWDPVNLLGEELPAAWPRTAPEWYTSILESIYMDDGKIRRSQFLRIRQRIAELNEQRRHWLHQQA